MKKVYKSPCKINIFLKITGTRDNYHEIASRFVLLDEPHDLMWFEPGNGLTFEIIGEFDCDRKDNTIYKAYHALLDYRPMKKIAEFCKKNKLVVLKRIPKFAGLGGGSSNAATFLKMLNEILELGLTNDELTTIGAKVGADIPFFIHGYKSANVFGIGEIVEPFEDEVPALELFTPTNIKCDTREVFKTFRKHFINSLEPDFAEELEGMSSKAILATYAPLSLNDLYKAVLKRYPEFYEHKRDGWFLSGSGSTIFKPKGAITI